MLRSLSLILLFLSTFLIGANAGNSYTLRNSIYPTVIFPRVFDEITTQPLETPLQIRAFFYLNVGSFNAWSNYHPTAVDFFGRSRFKRPSHTHTLRNKNTAIMFALFRVFEASPESFGGDSTMDEFRKIIRERGFDPDDTSVDTSTDVGVGNREGYDTARLMKMDGWDSAGDQTSTQETYRLPFRDYTGYTPVNTPWNIKCPFRWQPLLETDKKGFFFRQEHVVPQAGRGMMFSMTKEELERRKVPPMYKNPSAISGEELKSDLSLLRRRARSVFAQSAALNETKMVMAEFFDNKVKAFQTALNPGGTLSIAAAIRFVLLPPELDWSMDDDVIFGMAANIVAMDGTVLVWKEKIRNDAVRPTGQTMRYLFGNNKFKVWGGIGKKPVFIRAGEWQPYIRAMPHSEYPSASACLCDASVNHALIATGGKDDLPFTSVIPKGSSKFYPGSFPTKDYTLKVDKLSDWSTLCGKSRLWAGVHFGPSVSAGKTLCKGIEWNAQKVVDDLVAGKFSSTWMEWWPKDEEKFWEK